MKKNYKLFLLPLLALALLAISCEKPIPEPAPEPRDVTVPVGRTDGFSLTGIFDASVRAALQGGADGYYLEYAGKDMSFDVEPLKGFDPKKPFARYCNYPIGYDFTVGAKPAVPGISGDELVPLAGIVPASVDFGTRSKAMDIYFAGIPKEVLALESVTLAEGSHCDVTLSIPNAPFVKGAIRPHFNVDISHMFGSRDAEDGVIAFEEELSEANGYSVTRSFHLDDLSFDPENYDPAHGNIKVAARVILSGGVETEGLYTTANRLAAADDLTRMNVTVVLKDIACESVTGRFAYDMKSQSSKLSMKELVAGTPSLATLGLAFDKARYVLDVAGDTPVDVDIPVTLAARRGRKDAGSAGGILLDVEPGVLPRAYDLTEKAGAFVEGVPDEVEYTAGLYVPDETVTLLLGEKGTVTAEPRVKVPIAFGKDLRWEVAEKVSLPDGAGAALGDGKLRVEGTAVNTLPVNADVTVVICDKYGKALSEKVSASCGAKATAAVAFTAKALPGVDPSAADHILVTYLLTGADQSAVLTADDNIYANFSVVMPERKN